MKILKPVSVTQLSSSHLIGFCGTVSRAVEKLSEIDSFVARQHAGIVVALETVKIIEETPKKSELTPVIVETDSEMDELLKLCRDSLHSSANQERFFPVKAGASQRIKKLFDLRSDALYIGGHISQSSEIATLFLPLFSSEYDQDRIDCELAPIFDRVREIYEELEKLLLARQAEPKAPSTIGEVKEVLRFRISALLYHIDANIFDNVQGYKGLEVYFNNIITDVMAQHKARITRKRNRGEEKISDEEV